MSRPEPLRRAVRKRRHSPADDGRLRSLSHPPVRPAWHRARSSIHSGRHGQPSPRTAPREWGALLHRRPFTIAGSARHTCRGRRGGWRIRRRCRTSWRLVSPSVVFNPEHTSVHSAAHADPADLLRPGGLLPAVAARHRGRGWFAHARHAGPSRHGLSQWGHTMNSERFVSRRVFGVPQQRQFSPTAGTQPSLGKMRDRSRLKRGALSASSRACA